MRQTRIQKKARRPGEHGEALPLDPRDPDVLRAKRLLVDSDRPDPMKHPV
jgi:hypothetical protein